MLKKKILIKTHKFKENATRKNLVFFDKFPSQNIVVWEEINSKIYD